VLAPTCPAGNARPGYRTGRHIGADQAPRRNHLRGARDAPHCEASQHCDRDHHTLFERPRTWHLLTIVPASFLSTPTPSFFVSGARGTFHARRTVGPCSRDRNAKYNQLIRIQESLGSAAQFAGAVPG